MTREIYAEYVDLAVDNTAPRLRAWVREADQVCRANLRLLYLK